jgi:integrase
VGQVTAYQRGGRYWVYFLVAIRPNRPPNLSVAAKINAELAEGAPTSLSFRPLPLKELVDKWIDQHERVRRSSVATVRRYLTAVKHLTRFTEQVHSGLRADRFGPALAEDFVRHLRSVRVSPNGHAKTRKRAMRDKGVVFVLGTCRALFNFARQQRHLPPYAPNPFSGLSIDRMAIEDAKPIRPLTGEQELAFFEACDEWQFGVFFVLAFTGLRVGELTHLMIDTDVSLVENLLRVSNKPGLHWRVKTRNVRVVPLLPEVRQVLSASIGDRRTGPVFMRRRFSSAGGKSMLAGRSVIELERVVQDRIEAAGSADRLEVARIARRVWRDAGAVKETAIRDEFMRVTRRAGMAHLTCPKDLRHLFATSLQAAGVDPIVRRDVMGHTTLAMTAHYTHTQDGTRNDPCVMRVALRHWFRDRSRTVENRGRHPAGLGDDASVRRAARRGGVLDVDAYWRHVNDDATDRAADHRRRERI